MQHLLTDKEFENYVHKDRIRIPVDEFVKELERYIHRGTKLETSDVVIPIVQLQNHLNTLKIKLDL